MAFIPVDIKDWIQTVSYGVGAIVALWSLRQYFRNSARERTRWLFDLYHRFYEDAALKQMRSRIDWGETSFVREETDRQLMQELDDYLNFFEFIAYLLETGELKREEILAMFDYPLRRIATDKWVCTYVQRQDYGYEGLSDLLKKLGYARQYESASG